MEYEAGNKFGAEITDPGRGKHIWQMIAVFKVEHPEKAATEPVHMDMENLMTVDGPGCFKCEKMYTPDIARRFCQGSVRNLQ